MNRIAIFFLLAAAALQGGCGKTSAAARMKLAGGWAPPGSACDSAGGVVYDKGGAWAGYDVSGRWILNGDRLTTWIDERGGFDRPARKVEGEKPVTSTIVSLSRTDLTLRLDDGSTQVLKRCRG